MPGIVVQRVVDSTLRFHHISSERKVRASGEVTGTEAKTQIIITEQNVLYWKDSGCWSLYGLRLGAIEPGLGLLHRHKLRVRKNIMSDATDTHVFD